MREDFVIVDMSRQREAILSQVKGKAEAEIVGWLGRRGSITSRTMPNGTQIYDFVSNQNILTIVYFYEGKLTFFYEY